MQFQLNIREKYFNMIKNGKKTIELRLQDEKRKNIKIDDTLVFSSNDSELLAKVTNIYRAESFEKLSKIIDVNKAGFTTFEKLNEALLEFYSLDKQKEFGVLGIEIKVIN